MTGRRPIDHGYRYICGANGASKTRLLEFKRVGWRSRTSCPTGSELNETRPWVGRDTG